MLCKPMLFQLVADHLRPKRAVAYHSHWYSAPMEFVHRLTGTRHYRCRDGCFPECQFQFRRRTVKADAQELVNEPGQRRPWGLDSKLIAALRHLLRYCLRSCQHQLDREVG